MSSKFGRQKKDYPDSGKWVVHPLVGSGKEVKGYLSRDVEHITTIIIKWWGKGAGTDLESERGRDLHDHRQ